MEAAQHQPLSLMQALTGARALGMHLGNERDQAQPAFSGAAMSIMLCVLRGQVPGTPGAPRDKKSSTGDCFEPPHLSQHKLSAPAVVTTAKQAIQYQKM